MWKAPVTGGEAQPTDYDHAHPSTPLVERVGHRSYAHDTRHDGPALADHSGLAVELAPTAIAPPIMSDPAADRQAAVF